MSFLHRTIISCTKKRVRSVFLQVGIQSLMSRQLLRIKINLKLIEPNCLPKSSNARESTHGLALGDVLPALLLALLLALVLLLAALLVTAFLVLENSRHV